VIQDAVAAGDLQLADDFGVEYVAFGLWSITFGGYSLAATSPSLTNLGIHEPLLAIRANSIRLLDGLGWKPQSSELDLSPLVERIKREVFPAEYAQIKRLGSA
jgi:hypothetical protein